MTGLGSNEDLPIHEIQHSKSHLVYNFPPNVFYVIPGTNPILISGLAAPLFINRLWSKTHLSLRKYYKWLGFLAIIQNTFKQVAELLQLSNFKMDSYAVVIIKLNETKKMQGFSSSFKNVFSMSVLAERFEEKRKKR